MADGDDDGLDVDVDTGDHSPVEVNMPSVRGFDAAFFVGALLLAVILLLLIFFFLRG